MRTFITGVTGFVGANICSEFLKDDKDLQVLVRAGDKGQAISRLNKALALSVHGGSWHKDLKISLGDVTEKNLGLSDEEFLILKKEGVDIFCHSAGSLSFAKKDSKATFATNYHGLVNVLKFVEELGIKDFHYISTAFVHGNSVCSKEYGDLSDFNNPYEMSKFCSENTLQAWAKKNPHVSVYIYRPSIIVGDELSGKVFSLSGYYTYMGVLFATKQMAEKGKIILNNENLLQEDIFSLPINVLGDYDAEINIISIDYFLYMFREIRRQQVAGVYEIVNDKPPIYGELLEMGLKYFNMDSVEVGEIVKDSTRNKTVSRVERMIARGMKEYAPYISRTYDWDLSSLRNVLGDSYKSHISTDENFVSVLLKYAVENNFEVKI